MKTILTIVLLLAAMMAVKTSNANSQDVCTPKYVSCMDACVAKKTGLDPCIAACQQKNDDCAANVYGTTAAPETVSADPAKQPGDAMEARDEARAEASKAASRDAAKPRVKTPQQRKQDVR